MTCGPVQWDLSSVLCRIWSRSAHEQSEKAFFKHPLTDAVEALLCHPLEFMRSSSSGKLLAILSWFELKPLADFACLHE